MKIKNGFLKKTSIYFIGTLSTKMINILLTIILTALTIFIVAVLGLGLFAVYKIIKETLKDF